MYCAQCSEKIQGRPVRQGADIFCSMECANQAAGLETEEEEGYYEEEPIVGLYEEEEE